MLRVSNQGRQDHQLRLVRLHAGATLNDFMSAADPDSISTAIAGVSRIGPGAMAYLPVRLPAGSYIAYCLISDPASHKLHVELGMLRLIQVE